jgi:hypothetical protein
MATKDIKSTFTVEAKGRGFDELIRRTQTLGQGLAEDKLTGGFKRLDHFTKQVERQFRGMERHLKSLNQVLHQVGKSADKMDQLAKSMEKVAKAAEKARGTGTVPVAQAAGADRGLSLKGSCRASGWASSSLGAQAWGARSRGACSAAVSGGLARWAPDWARRRSQGSADYSRLWRPFPVAA